MNPPSMPVSVWMEKRAVASRWATHEWRVAAVTMADQEPAPGPEGALLLHAGHAVSLFRDEAEGYYLNTSSGSPMVFVMWRIEEEGDGGETAVPMSVTLSYNEAARLMDAQEKVDAVPLPAALLPWLTAYVAEHYKPEPKKKRARPSFLSPSERGRL